MPFVPNLSRAGLAARGAADPTLVAWPFIDELYDYMPLVAQGNPIGKLPAAAQGMQVGIIGAGPAGMVAAYELLKLGLTPTVFEASERIGGRNWSASLDPGIAEMGAMRVPVQNKVFWHYATDVFGLDTLDFPDPGDVPTLLYYENTIYPMWNPNKVSPAPPAPPPFDAIGAAFGTFATNLTKDIWANWSNLALVQQLWQQAIDKYKDTSFYEAIVAGIPGWSTEDLNRFGALGMGSGGFGPLYSVGFLELYRILVNQFEVEQSMIKQGISAVTDGFYTEQVTWPNGQQVSLQKLDCVQLGTHIESVEYNEGTKQVTLTWNDLGVPQQQTFDAVIVATTTRSMEVLGLTAPLPTDAEFSVVSEPVKTAIRNLHLMESSKLFIRTQTKFWQDQNGNPVPGMPQDIQTDELPRQVYCLDYGPDVDYGVVLISYTWGDDSAKLLALPVEDRLGIFTNIIGNFHSGFAANLKNPDAILNVDWETEMDYYGAFKLQYPGQDSYAQDAYFQFQSVLDADTDCSVYLAGDSVSWAGGWTEGALHTGLNAACAVVARLGGSFYTNNPPLKINPQLYTYSDS